MISWNAGYGAGQQAQFASMPVTPDLSTVPTSPSGPKAAFAFMPAGTAAPIIPAQAPVIINSNMPQATPLSMPSVVATATTVLPPPGQGLQPSDLLHPLPSIVNTAPVTVSNPCASTFEQWVSDNPMLALLGLGALAYALLGRKGK